nr:MAG TPA: replisome organizer [Caudoviricetes sp.]
MPNRILRDSIRTSDSISHLSWFEEVLFYRLMVSCDDYGRYDGRPAVIKGTCFPLNNVTVKDIERALTTLETYGMVFQYIVDGKPYVQLLNWEKYQSIRAKESKYPSPSDGVQKKKHEAFCEHVQSDENICKQVKADEVTCEQMSPNPNSYSYSYSNSDIHPQADAHTCKQTESESGKKELRHRYGPYQNVLLTDVQLAKLKKECPDDWQERIERLSEYMASKGAKYKDHLATIRAWKRKEKPPDQPYVRKDYSDDLPF